MDKKEKKSFIDKILESLDSKLEEKSRKECSCSCDSDKKVCSEE